MFAIFLARPKALPADLPNLKPARPPSAISSINFAVNLSNFGSPGLFPAASTTSSKTLFVNLIISSPVAPTGNASTIFGPKYFSTSIIGSPPIPPPPSRMYLTSSADMTSFNCVLPKLTPLSVTSFFNASTKNSLADARLPGMSPLLVTVDIIPSSIIFLTWLARSGSCILSCLIVSSAD